MLRSAPLSEVSLCARAVIIKRLAAAKHPTSHLRLAPDVPIWHEGKFANVVVLSAFDCVDAATIPAVSRPTRLSERAMDLDWRWPGLLAGLLMTLGLSSQLAIAEDVESPKDDIAAQIRAQGYACDQPQSATRDPQASRPDEEVWLLRCEGRAIVFVLYPTWRRRLNELIVRPAPPACSALGECPLMALNGLPC